LKPNLKDRKKTTKTGTLWLEETLSEMWEVSEEDRCRPRPKTAKADNYQQKCHNGQKKRTVLGETESTTGCRYTTPTSKKGEKEKLAV